MGTVNDLTGQKFNYLTVIKRVPKPEHFKNKGAYWLCQCGCGNNRIIRGSTLLSGNSSSCGCLRNQNRAKLNKIISSHIPLDLTGQRFGKWTVIKSSPKPKKNRRNSNLYWLCRCDCGNERIIPQLNLTRKKSKSCGCLYIRKGRPRLIDITGGRYGSLVVLHKVPTPSHLLCKKTHWLCRCDCGAETICAGKNLRTGNTKSCGCIRNIKRDWKKGEASFLQVYRTYIREAKNRNYSFNLTKSQFRKLTQKHCHYCGTEPSNCNINEIANGHYTYNGLDRVNNSQGYTMKNVVPCCLQCNRAKRTLTKDEFLSWIERVHDHQKQNMRMT